VVALNTNSITVKSRTGETVFLLDEKPVITSLKPIQLVDLKTPKWATIYREPPRGETNVITVAWLKVAPQALEGTAMEKESPGKPQPPMAMRVNLRGTLKVDGQSGSLQTDGQTLNLKFTERTRVYEASPAILNDVKIGANVMLDLGVVGGQYVAKGIDLLSPDEPGTRNTR
jgi:hypothetical protein